MTQLELDVLNTIGTGHENAVPGSVLAQMFGTTVRQIRKTANSLIQKEIPICNYMDGKGYFKPATAEDIDREYAKRSAFIKDLLKTRYRLKKAKDSFIYQTSTLSDANENTEKTAN